MPCRVSSGLERLRSASAIGSAAILAIASPTIAQMDTPPEMTFQQLQRVVEVDLRAQNSSTNQGEDPAEVCDETRESTASGPFIQNVPTKMVSGNGGSEASGSASQKTMISTFIIEGEGMAQASAQGGANETIGDAGTDSAVVALFTVPVNATFSLTGRLEGSETGSNSAVLVTVTLNALGANGLPIFINESFHSDTDTDPVEFFHAGEFMANSPIGLSVGIGAGATETSSNTSSAMGSFQFEFNLGDTDGDGLLDDWETNGIDVDGDEVPDVKIHMMGADPMKKDIFVELDAMSGIPFDQTAQSAIDRVISVFNQAPAEFVDNPNGQAGINLHVMVDEADLPASVINSIDDIDALKMVHFGSDDDQGLPEPKKTDLREARLKVFRYCLWAAAIVQDGKATTGIGERPGNDFIVAAAFTANTFSTAPEDALAGTFMHELGHTLGLRHGGHDAVPYKPNYLSVMNYRYQAPFAGTEDSWVLDYSRTTMQTLDETKLSESAGVDGPPDKDVIYNSAPSGQPPIRTSDLADSATIDWNAVNGIEPGTIMHDISHLIVGEMTSLQTSLEGSTDWNRLWYHLSGDGNFEDGIGRTPGSIPVELTEDQIIAIAASPVLDLTRCAGDANGDDTVNFADITSVLNNWLDDYTPGSGAGDANIDGLVNFADITTVLNNWLDTCP